MEVTSTITVPYQMFCDVLLLDLKNLGNEARKKHPHIKDSCDLCSKKLQDISKAPNPWESLKEFNLEVTRPFLMGCHTKVAKMVNLSLNGMQRMINFQAVTEEAAAAFISTMWILMEFHIEELKLLQTAILLITTNSVVKDQQLAKALVLCFRLHFTKNSATISTAAATIQQCTHAVFERVVQQEMSLDVVTDKAASPTHSHSKSPHSSPVHTTNGSNSDQSNAVAASHAAVSQSQQSESSESVAVVMVQSASSDDMTSSWTSTDLSLLSEPARDAYHLFMDICLLVSGESPTWLHGMTEMTRTLGMEIIESVLVTYPKLFRENAFFISLLKERVCPLVIRLFSPSLKFKQSLANSNHNIEKPSFPLVCRLVRLIHVIVTNFFYLLNTECEIFLSCLLRFLDSEKPTWQRALALEVLYKFAATPRLLSHICECYDMKEQSCKIFYEMISSLNGFLQSAFHGQIETAVPNSPTGQGKENPVSGVPPAMVGGLAVGPGVSPKAAFVYKNMFFPVHALPKVLFLDMMEKMEAPTPADGYNVTMAFRALLEVVNSLQRIVDSHEAEVQPKHHRQLQAQLINFSWCGILAAFSLLLEASCDESATEDLLRANQTMVSLCGTLGITAPRDAFITLLCKASLPHNYIMALMSLASSASTAQTSVAKGVEGSMGSVENCPSPQTGAETGFGFPVVGLPSSYQLSQMPPTSKNLQCMRAILSLAHCHGSVLQQSWYLVLTTLQHLVWIVGLQVSPSSSSNVSVMKKSSPAGGGTHPHLESGGNTGTTASSHNSGAPIIALPTTPGSVTAVLDSSASSDLHIIAAMVSRLFESSRYLEDEAMDYLICALCRLTCEAVDVAKAGKDPSLFPIAKLMETGNINMFRLDKWWHSVSANLLEVCRCSHTELRHLGGIAVVSLVRWCIDCNKLTPPFWENGSVNAMVLETLSQMSGIPFQDVKQKQLDAVQTILHSHGPNIGSCWWNMLHIIGSINDTHNEQLVRNAFQCVQLVTSDYLLSLHPSCHEELVKVVTHFARQRQDLNIALTAIGSLWHLTDHFYTQREQIGKNKKNDLEEEASSSVTNGTSSSSEQSLWLCMMSQLALLCVDSRPAVRKSAGQTLFNTLESHGGVLKPQSLLEVLWKVLFPLLEQVQEFSVKAPETRDEEDQGNLLMHHSRDTVAKQWAETRVLTLMGVAQFFVGPRSALLTTLEDFPRGWKLLLEFIETCGLCDNAEVALNALKCLEELQRLTLTPESSSPPDSNTPSRPTVEDLWWLTWLCWCKIALNATVIRPFSTPQSASPVVNETPSMPLVNNIKKPTVFIPSQNFLTLLVETSVRVLERVQRRLSTEDVEHLFLGVRQTLLVPVSASAAPFLLPTNYQENNLTILQETVLKLFTWLLEKSQRGAAMQHVQVTIFLHVSDFVQFAVHVPKYATLNSEPLTFLQRDLGRTPPMNFVSFGEKCLSLVCDTYKRCADEPQIIEGGILEEIIKALRMPLSMKYSCPSQTTWKLSIQCLTTVVTAGVPVARQHETHCQSMWSILSDTIHDFLFPTIQATTTISMEECKEHEKFDCQFVHLIRDQFLSNANGLPEFFIEAMIALLNKGSIHSTTSSSLSELQHGQPFREDFAELCFETLLKYSFRDCEPADATSTIQKQEQQPTKMVNRVAIRAILQRCKSVLARYVEDDRLAGNCPLPRTRLSEVAFVLKAMRKLLQTFKAAPKSKIDTDTWQQVLEMYPHAVDCVMIGSSQFMRPLRQVLHEYRDLLRPPLDAP